MILEKEIQKGILKYLSYNKNCLVWRNNTGGFGGEYKGKKWFVRAGLKGSADIFVIVGPQGKFVAIEVKRPGSKQTDDQKKFQADVEALGGTYILARGVDDVIARGL